MEVAAGSQAGLAWERLIHAPLPAREKTKLRNALLAYCAQDTLALVKVLPALLKTATRRPRVSTA
jgi:hypothetical protein